MDSHDAIQGPQAEKSAFNSTRAAVAMDSDATLGSKEHAGHDQQQQAAVTTAMTVTTGNETA